MIKIGEFKTYLQTFVTRIEAITKVKLVTTENQLVKYINDFEDTDIVLVGIIPSADSKGRDVDNLIEMETVLLFILGKINSSSQNEDDEFSKMETFQNTITALKSLLVADKENTEIECTLMKGLDLNSIHTDPEYNYLGCNGYSLAFNIISHGF